MSGQIAKIQPPTIFIFTWNTDGLNICKTAVGTSTKIKKYERIQLDATGGFKCALPNFMEAFRNVVQESMKNAGFGTKYPDILVFATQGEPKSNKEFKDFLYTRLADFGYNNLIFEELDGVHEPLKRIDGKGSGTGSIRQSVFVLKDFKDRIEVWREKFDLFGILTNNYATAGVRTKGCPDKAPSSGAVATYIKIRNYDGLLAFVNVHLPDIIDKTTKQVKNRAQIMEDNEKCLNAIVEHLLDNDNIETPKIDLNYIFIMGDLNYEINKDLVKQKLNADSSYDFIAKNNNLSIENIAKRLYSCDEFNSRRVPKTTLGVMHEGINYRRGTGKPLVNTSLDSGLGPGPEFLPTWKLKSVNLQRNEAKKEDKYKRRISNCLQNQANKIECYDSTTQNASWRDRILYMNRGNASASVVCLTYDMFDAENITYSDHAAVVGLFTLIGDNDFNKRVLESEVRHKLASKEKRLGKITIELEKLESKRRKIPVEEYKKERIVLDTEADNVRSEITKIIQAYPQFGYYSNVLPAIQGASIPVTQKPQTTKLQLDTIFYYNDDVNMYSFPFHLDSKGKAYYILDPVEYNNIYISYNFIDKKWYCYRIDVPDDVSTKITVECPPEAKLPPKILNRLPTNYDINDLSEYISAKRYSSWYNISQYTPNIPSFNPLNLGFSK